MNRFYLDELNYLFYDFIDEWTGYKALTSDDIEKLKFILTDHICAFETALINKINTAKEVDYPLNDIIEDWLYVTIKSREKAAYICLAILCCDWVEILHNVLISKKVG